MKGEINEMILKNIKDKIDTDQKRLRRISKEVKDYDVERLRLIERLREANKTGWADGAGLSAIQINIPLRFAYIVLNEKEELLINPKILTKFGTQKSIEGCLSIPHEHYVVERAVSIEYESNEKKKKAKGFKAILIQHEIDHMDGILVCDIGKTWRN